MTSFVTTGHTADVIAAETGFASAIATKAMRMSESMAVVNKERSAVTRKVKKGIRLKEELNHIHTSLRFQPL